MVSRKVPIHWQIIDLDPPKLIRNVRFVKIFPWKYELRGHDSKRPNRGVPFWGDSKLAYKNAKAFAKSHGFTIIKLSLARRIQIRLGKIEDKLDALKRLRGLP